MTNPDLLEKKAHLRRTMVALRDATAPTAAARAAERAAALLPPALGESRLVAMYSAIRSEFNPGLAAARLLGEGIALAFPRVERSDGSLRFYRVADLTALRTGHMGILEPASPLQPVSHGEIDAFVVPGLAFDARGARLGWGKGYYDRTLLGSPGALRIGLCFASQLVENAPVGPGDAAMDCVITETGGVHCGRRAETE